jgi:hypothetical protein
MNFNAKEEELGAKCKWREELREMRFLWAEVYKRSGSYKGAWNAKGRQKIFKFIASYLPYCSIRPDLPHGRLSRLTWFSSIPQRRLQDYLGQATATSFQCFLIWRRTV